MPENIMSKFTFAQLKSQIKEAGYNWQAGEPPISKLSEEDQDLHLGLDVPKSEMERIKLALAEKEFKAFTFAQKSDWRDKKGKNWVTPIRDQGGCGSCVAFATVAAIECQARIQYEESTWDLDLSEADLFFCGAGRKCGQGWWPTYALDYAKDKGIPDDECFPYQDQDINCTPCSDRVNRLFNIEKWYEIINIDQRKEWLDQKGPLIACMAVYRDFFNYKDGVYRHTAGDLAGYHAISCIGYSEEEECWICKNSWGTEWGNKGFFKIAYGEAEIDTEFAMYSVENITGNEEEDCGWVEYAVVDYFFETNKRVLWAYVNKIWRYQLVSDAQLMGIGSNLFDANNVRACYKGDKLTKIQVWKEFTNT